MNDTAYGNQYLILKLPILFKEAVATVTMAKRELDVGIVGAGIGGVMASIAIARAGGKVTILEAAEQLGEIGAGIQMVHCTCPGGLAFY